MTERTLRRAGAVLACVLFAGILWHWRVLAPVRPSGSIGRWNADLYTIYVPLFSWAFRHGPIPPAWNPFQLAGMPGMAGYNGGLLYPPHWLAAVLPVGTAIGWSCVLHFALAAGGVLACARGIGVGWPGAALAAITFASSDLFLAAHVHPSYLAGHAWIPVIAWAAGRLLARPTTSAGIVLGCAVAAQFLTGHPQIVWYTTLGGGGGVLAWIATDAGTRGLSHLAAVARAGVVGVVVAVGLSAMQLLPTLEVVGMAARTHLTLEQTMPWEPTLASLGLALGMGPGLLLVPIAALDTRRWRLVAVGMLLATVTMLIAVGWPPARDLFYQAALGDRFRLPFRVAFVGQVALAVVAGLGLDRLSRLGERASVTHGLVPRISPRVRVVFAWIIVAVVGVERLQASPNNLVVPQHHASSFFLPPPPFRWVAEHAGPERVLVVKDWNRRFPFMEKAGSMWGFHGVQDYEPLAPSVYPQWFAPLAAANIDAPLFWGRLSPAPELPGWRMLDLLATRWVVTPKAGPWAGPPAARFRLAHEDAVGVVYENLDAVPRARLVASHRVLADVQALRWIGAKSFDPRTEVMLARAPSWSDGGTPAAEDAVTWREDGADRVVLDVAAAGRRVLVLADLDWPGWTVTVDGRPREILRANALVRAVAIEPGRHRVEFAYAPWRIRVGALVTLGTLAAVIAFALLRGRRLTRA